MSDGESLTTHALAKKGPAGMFRINKSLHVLAIGAHPDDIELGAGGFIHRLVKGGAKVDFLILTMGIHALEVGKPYEEPQRVKESKTAARQLGLRDENVTILQFPDTRLHDHGHQIIQAVEDRLLNSKRSARYSMVLTHGGQDTHGDHRAVAESTLSAVRDFQGTVLCYPAPSTPPDGFHPNFFVRLNEDDIRQKELALMAHVSQRDKPFMKRYYSDGLTSAWRLFLRLGEDDRLEAFEVYKSFC